MRRLSRDVAALFSPDGETREGDERPDPDDPPSARSQSAIQRLLSFTKKPRDGFPDEESGTSLATLNGDESVRAEPPSPPASPVVYARYPSPSFTPPYVDTSLEELRAAFQGPWETPVLPKPWTGPSHAELMRALSSVRSLAASESTGDDSASLRASEGGEEEESRSRSLPVSLPVSLPASLRDSPHSSCGQVRRGDARASRDLADSLLRQTPLSSQQEYLQLLNSLLTLDLCPLWDDLSGSPVGVGEGSQRRPPAPPLSLSYRRDSRSATIHTPTRTSLSSHAGRPPTPLPSKSSLLILSRSASYE